MSDEIRKAAAVLIEAGIEMSGVGFDSFDEDPYWLKTPDAAVEYVAARDAYDHFMATQHRDHAPEKKGAEK